MRRVVYWHHRLHTKIEDIILTTNIDEVPSVDAFNASFFQACWDTIKVDVMTAIMDFFNTRQQLK